MKAKKEKYKFSTSLLSLILAFGLITFSGAILGQITQINHRPQEILVNPQEATGPIVQDYHTQSSLNYVGFSLIVFGLTFLLAEIFFMSGIFAAGGAVAFIFGSILLLEVGVLGYKITLSLILGVSVIALLFIYVIIHMAIKARSRPIVSGQEEIIDSVGEIVKAQDDIVFMRLRGELWQVKAKEVLKIGEKVKVLSREGLILWVKPEEREPH